jgi:hypothetical protein
VIAVALVRLAVRALPAEERQRWRDEWLAELDEARASMGSPLRFASALCTGAAEMAWTFHRRRAALLSAGTHRHGMEPTAAARPPYNAGVEFWS